MASSPALNVQTILRRYDSRWPSSDFRVSIVSLMMGLTKCCHCSSPWSDWVLLGVWLYALEYLVKSYVVVVLVERDMLVERLGGREVVVVVGKKA